MLLLRLDGEGVQRTEIARLMEIDRASACRVLADGKTFDGERKVTACTEMPQTK